MYVRDSFDLVVQYTNIANVVVDTNKKNIYIESLWFPTHLPNSFKKSVKVDSHIFF